MDNIRVIASKLFDPANVPLSPRLLAEIIDNINATFKKDYVDQNKISELFTNEGVSNNAINGKINIDFKLYPFNHLIWNRYVANLERPKNMYFVHGHDIKDCKDHNIFNLDNVLGKTLNCHNQGEYNVLYTMTPSVDLALQQDGADINNEPGSSSQNIKFPLHSNFPVNASSVISNNNLFEIKKITHLVKYDQDKASEETAFDNSSVDLEQVFKLMKCFFINDCELNSTDERADVKRRRQGGQPETEIKSLHSMELDIQPLLFQSSNVCSEINFSAENTRSIHDVEKLKRKIQEIG